MSADEQHELLARAIRTLLPGLRVANYVERWCEGSPAVRALSILSEHVGGDPVVAGDLVDSVGWSAHIRRPAGEPESLTAERDALAAKIAAVEIALAGHPECDRHDDEDVIKCGWKRTVLDVRAALGGLDG